MNDIENKEQPKGSEVKKTTSDEDMMFYGLDASIAADASWKVMQKKTFTRWTNEHLKTVQKMINDLESDLSDGLRLITLVEVLSGKRIKEFNKKPISRVQKLDNVSIVLEFLDKVEDIKMVNIRKCSFLSALYLSCRACKLCWDYVVFVCKQP